MEKKQYIVLGLGIFGSTIVETLSRYGCEVLAIDKNPNLVQHVAEYATKSVVGDITDEDFLKELDIGDFDVGIVAIGDQLENAILGIMNLKEMGVPYIIAKANNDRFKEVLEKVGADKVVRPEEEMGSKVARTLLRKNITDLIEIDENYSVVEMKIPQAWVGRTLSDLQLRQNYGINILGKRNKDTHKLELTIDPQYVLQFDDHFLMIAETQRIEDMDYLVVK